MHVGPLRQKDLRLPIMTGARPDDNPVVLSARDELTLAMNRRNTPRRNELGNKLVTICGFHSQLALNRLIVRTAFFAFNPSCPKKPAK